jgi:hypothetical protein
MARNIGVKKPAETGEALNRLPYLHNGRATRRELSCTGIRIFWRVVPRVADLPPSGRGQGIVSLVTAVTKVICTFQQPGQAQNIKRDHEAPSWVARRIR